MGFYCRVFLVFLMKESKKRGQKQPDKLMAKSRSQPVNLPGAWPLMNPLHTLHRHQMYLYLKLQFDFLVDFYQPMHSVERRLAYHNEISVPNISFLHNKLTSLCVL